MGESQPIEVKTEIVYYNNKKGTVVKKSYGSGKSSGLYATESLDDIDNGIYILNPRLPSLSAPFGLIDIDTENQIPYGREKDFIDSFEDPQKIYAVNDSFEYAQNNSSWTKSPLKSFDEYRHQSPLGPSSDPRHGLRKRRHHEQKAYPIYLDSRASTADQLDDKLCRSNSRSAKHNKIHFVISDSPENEHVQESARAGCCSIS